MSAENDLAQRCAKAMWDDDKASPALGMELLGVRCGYALMRMKVREDMLNGHGTAHGAFAFALADSCFAFACNSKNQRSVAQHCSISYLLPIQRDDILTAECTEQVLEGRSGIYDCLVRNQHDEIVASFRGHSRTIAGTLVEAF